MPKKTPYLEVSSAERLLRVEKVYEMILMSNSRPQILKFCNETWGVKVNATDKYIIDAKKLLRESLASSREDKLDKAIGQREMVLSKLLEVESYGLALQYMVDKAKLETLYEDSEPDTGVDVTIVQK